jgi:hypothetical protein
MMTPELLNLLGHPDDETRISPTSRLFLLALYPSNELTIREVCDFSGSTPFVIQRLGAEMAKKGMVSRRRVGRVMRYSLPLEASTTTQPIA